VEKVERYKTAQLAREIELALPVELTAEQNISLVREYVNQHFVSAGMCADIAIHDTGEGNPHAHIMLTMRPIENGKWGAKSKTVDGVKIPTVDWNEQTKAEVWREGWANAVNAILEHHNHEQRVDHRSYERQGIDQIPTIHLGAAAHQMEQRGIATERGNINREIRALNRQLRKLKSQMSKAKKDISKLAQKPEPPTVIDEGKPYTMQDAEREISDMLNEQSEIQGRLKPIEGWLKVLNDRLKQVAIHKKTKPFYDAYKALPPRKQKKYFAEYKKELELFKSANAYLNKHRNAEGKIPVAAWVKEHQQLTAEKKEISKSTMSLSERFRQIDRIRKKAKEVTPKHQPRRDRGWEMEH
jgi:ATP-dependent exoDNAse (exonuclease V) alpha subunit